MRLLRGGQLLHVNIAGRDRLASEHKDVMLEAATTSFQIHLKSPADLAHLHTTLRWRRRGRSWRPAERAFPLRQGVVGGNAHSAVRASGEDAGPREGLHGPGYADQSLIEIFEENLRDYEALLPVAYDDPPEVMRHLRLHNGVIWRWNCR